MQRKIKRKFVSLMLAASLAGSPLATFPMNVFAGTGKNGVIKAPKTKKVTGILFSGCPTNNIINIGKEYTLTAIFLPPDAYADYKKVEWSSSNTDVATVDKNTGKVTAKAPGTATITATAKNESTNENDWKSTSVDITVAQPVTGFTISGAPDNNTINVDKNLTLTADNFKPENAYVDYQKVEWSSNNPGVATVDADGNVTAKAPGTVKITATAKNGSTDENDWESTSVDITVLQPVTGFTISGAPDNNTINVDKEFTLQAGSFEPDGAYVDYQKVEWSSNNPGVATVDKNTGNVTAKAPGTAKITATAKNGSTDENDWESTSVDITVTGFIAESIKIKGAESTVKGTFYGKNGKKVVDGKISEADIGDIINVNPGLNEDTVTIKDTVNVSGELNLINDVIFIVNGTVNFNNGVVFNGAFEVNGTVNFNNGVVFNGAFEVNGTVNFNNGVVFNGAFKVNGTININNGAKCTCWGNIYGILNVNNSGTLTIPTDGCCINVQNGGILHVYRGGIFSDGDKVFKYGSGQFVNDNN